jgi:hypothetical protein
MSFKCKNLEIGNYTKIAKRWHSHNPNHENMPKPRSGEMIIEKMLCINKPRSGEMIIAIDMK